MTDPIADFIADFYDEFRDQRMVGYRLFGNKRLRLANRFVLRHVRRDSAILEVGCGIGVTTGRLARRARAGHVWAFDLSPRNIDFARATVKHANVSLEVLDVLTEPERLRSWVSRPVDVVVFVDVLEHIPVDRHRELFQTLLTVGASTMKILMTFPTPEYQAYLREYDVDELQPVDEDITASHLEQTGGSLGFLLAEWRRLDVWRTSQYVHAVLSRGPSMSPHGAFSGQTWGSVKRVLSRVARPLLRRRFRNL